jgi:hypothetical protein
VPLGPALGGFARSGGLFRDPAPPALSRSDLVEANVLERDGDRARLTAFGRWVVDTWVEEQLERFEGLA